MISTILKELHSSSETISVSGILSKEGIPMTALLVNDSAQGVSEDKSAPLIVAMMACGRHMMRNVFHGEDVDWFKIQYSSGVVLAMSTELELVLVVCLREAVDEEKVLSGMRRASIGIQTCLASNHWRPDDALIAV
jgi:predicted regulator of Ras-like GTPase activity (Roadblock/LC7/MglB family)